MKAWFHRFPGMQLLLATQRFIYHPDAMRAAAEHAIRRRGEKHCSSTLCECKNSISGYMI